MTSIDAAQAYVDTLKSCAVALGEADYNVEGRGASLVKLRCTYKPNMSYGRWQEPVPGDEEYQWEWTVWSVQQAREAPAHQSPRQRGWVGLPGEPWAKALLGGVPWRLVRAELEKQGQVLAERFS